MKIEKIIKALNGYLVLGFTILLFIGGVYGMINENYWSIALFLIGAFLIRGFFLVNPNSSKILLLFGK